MKKNTAPETASGSQNADCKPWKLNKAATIRQNAAHTPGPWTTESISAENGMGRDIFVIPDDDSEDWIAKTAGGKSAKANARLIASAPDLLSACRELLSECRDLRELVSKGRRDGDLPAMLKARAAIRKATGEEVR